MPREGGNAGVAVVISQCVATISRPPWKEGIRKDRYRGAIVELTERHAATSKGTAILETIAALGGALGLTLAATAVTMVLGIVLVTPLDRRVEVPLHPIDPNASHGVLIERVDREKIARTAHIDTTDYPAVLVLEGLDGAESVEPTVLGLLAASGYMVSTADFRPVSDPTDILEDPRFIVVGLGIQAVVFTGLGWILMRWRLGKRETGAPANVAICWGVLAGVGAVAVGVALGLFLEWLGIPVHEQELLVRLLSNPATLLLLAPFVVLAAPVSEEIFFRGYVFGHLERRAGWILAIGVSSLMFAAVHLNLSGLPIYIAVGAIFALGYAKTRNLVTPIVAHVVYNSILLVFTAITGL